MNDNGEKSSCSRSSASPRLTRNKSLTPFGQEALRQAEQEAAFLAQQEALRRMAQQEAQPYPAINRLGAYLLHYGAFLLNQRPP